MEFSLWGVLRYSDQNSPIKTFRQFWGTDFHQNVYFGVSQLVEIENVHNFGGLKNVEIWFMDLLIFTNMDGTVIWIIVHEKGQMMGQFSNGVQYLTLVNFQACYCLQWLAELSQIESEPICGAFVNFWMWVCALLRRTSKSNQEFVDEVSKGKDIKSSPISLNNHILGEGRKEEKTWTSKEENFCLLRQFPAQHHFLERISVANYRISKITFFEKIQWQLTVFFKKKFKWM